MEVDRIEDMELVIGRVYKVKHSSGIIVAKFNGERTTSLIGSRRGHRYDFQNLKTGRMIELKSKQKVLREVRGENEAKLETIAK